MAKLVIEYLVQTTLDFLVGMTDVHAELLRVLLELTRLNVLLNVSGHTFVNGFRVHHLGLHYWPARVPRRCRFDDLNCLGTSALPALGSALQKRVDLVMQRALTWWALLRLHALCPNLPQALRLPLHLLRRHLLSWPWLLPFVGFFS